MSFAPISYPTASNANAIPFETLLEEFNAGKTVEEIAAAHNLTPRAVRVRLGKAARKTGTPFDRAKAAIGSAPTNPASTPPPTNKPAAPIPSEGWTPDAIVGCCEAIQSLGLSLFAMFKKAPEGFKLEPYLEFADNDRAALKGLAPAIAPKVATWFPPGSDASLTAFGIVLGGAIAKNGSKMAVAINKAREDENTRSNDARGIRRPTPVAHLPTNGAAQRTVGEPTGPNRSEGNAPSPNPEKEVSAFRSERESERTAAAFKQQRISGAGDIVEPWEKHPVEFAMSLEELHNPERIAKQAEGKTWGTQEPT